MADQSAIAAAATVCQGRAAALVYALFKSDRAGPPVTIGEVVPSAVDAYGRELDEHLKLVPAATTVD